MERQFDFLMPSVNFFGPGVIKKIGDRAKMLNMHKVLVVTGGHIVNLENGPVAQTLDSLKAAGVEYVVFDGAEENPKIRDIKRVSKSTWTMAVTVSSPLVGPAHDRGKDWYILTNGDDITSTYRNPGKATATTDGG